MSIYGFYGAAPPSDAADSCCEAVEVSPELPPSDEVSEDEDEDDEDDDEDEEESDDSDDEAELEGAYAEWSPLQ